MSKDLNILLVLRSGGDFRIKDVKLLAKHILSKNTDLNIKIYCLTDLFCQKITLDCVTFLALENRWRGWWAKMNLFSPKLDSLQPFLYIDLDTSVLRPITSILPTDQQMNGVIMLRDFYHPEKSASGLMWIPANNNKIKNIWRRWLNAPELNMRKFRGDQEFIRSICSPDFYWQDISKGIVSYKPTKKKRVELDGNENIVCFHGKPRPREAAKSVKWVNDYLNRRI